MYIYIGENAHWDIYAPPPCKLLHKNCFQIILFYFFHFRCILLQISHKKCFFISISILGRSGVNAGDIDWESHTVCKHSINSQINEKILSVISSSGKDFTRNNKILDLLCTNKRTCFQTFVPFLVYPIMRSSWPTAT